MDVQGFYGMAEGVEFIRKIREQLGITRYRLASLMGLPTQTIDYYEDCGRNLTMERLCRLKDISGLNWQQLGEMIEKEYGNPRNKD
jgi:transcriptional regulator with XRE-family HTH domain